MATLEPIKLTVEVDMKVSPRLINLGGVWVDGGAIDAINVYRRPRPERPRWASVTIWMRDGRKIALHGDWLDKAAMEAIRGWWWANVEAPRG